MDEIQETLRWNKIWRKLRRSSGRSPTVPIPRIFRAPDAAWGRLRDPRLALAVRNPRADASERLAVSTSATAEPDRWRRLRGFWTAGPSRSVNGDLRSFYRLLPPVKKFSFGRWPGPFAWTERLAA